MLMIVYEWLGMFVNGCDCQWMAKIVYEWFRMLMIVYEWLGMCVNDVEWLGMSIYG